MPVKQAEISSWRREARVGVVEGGAGGCRVVVAVLGFAIEVSCVNGGGGAAVEGGNARAEAIASQSEGERAQISLPLVLTRRKALAGRDLRHQSYGVKVLGYLWPLKRND
jgi:hypothetical protein